MRPAVLSLKIILLSVFAAVLLAGCQSKGPVTSQKEGYFSWVDEQGRVQYTRIPEHGENLLPGPVSGETADASADNKAKADDASEYTLDNYPDGEMLHRAGNVRPGDPQPYFTWRDANGVVRVSYFTPDTRSDSDKGLAPAPVKLTPASIYHNNNRRFTEPVEGYDPNALAILGVEQEPLDEFSRFSRLCCQALNVQDATIWQWEREFGLYIGKDSPVHVFSTGRSPYGVVQLPSGDNRKAFVSRIRSYGRNGLFVPSLVFLDRDFRPVRMVTDLIPDYSPETWRRRGFLEAWVPVFPGRGERWLLVFTRDSELESQTVIETGQGPKVIPHRATGELGIATFEH